MIRIWKTGVKNYDTLATLRGQAVFPPSSWAKAKSTIPRSLSVRLPTCKIKKIVLGKGVTVKNKHLNCHRYRDICHPAQHTINSDMKIHFYYLFHI
jgi:hypothetical protein